MIVLHGLRQFWKDILPNIPLLCSIVILFVLTGCSSSRSDSADQPASAAIPAGDYHLSVCIDPPAEYDREAIGEIMARVVDSWNGRPVDIPNDTIPHDRWDLWSVLTHEAGHLAGIAHAHLKPGTHGAMVPGIAAGEQGRQRLPTRHDFALLGEAPAIYTLEYTGLGQHCQAPIFFAPLERNLAEASHLWGGYVNTNYPWHVPAI